MAIWLDLRAYTFRLTQWDFPLDKQLSTLQRGRCSNQDLVPQVLEPVGIEPGRKVLHLLAKAMG